MNYQELYKSKTITEEEAVLKVKSNDEIVVGLGASEPRMLLSNLHKIKDLVTNVSVCHTLCLGDYDFYSKPEMKGHFILNNWYYGPGARKMHSSGTVSYMPGHLRHAPFKRAAFKKPNIFFGTAAPMDKHGYLNLSVSLTYEKDTIEKADLVIIEVNPNFPRTHGETQLHIKDVDFVVETQYQVPGLPPIEPSEKDKIIGQYIADLVEDGSTIQLGIGGIPNAASMFLTHKKNLGVHTEMLSDSIVDLVESGAVNGSLKTLWKDKIIATFILGSKKIYDFVDGNQSVEIQRGRIVNDPWVIAQNYKMTSINTTLEVDLTGQCCSEAIGVRQYSGVGGQTDTAIGAQMSKDGKSIIALYSTAKNDQISTIVPILSPGAPVSLSRHDVDYVVTEFGIAAIRGTNIRERVERLIAISHPKFRDQLKKEAEKLMLW